MTETGPFEARYSGTPCDECGGTIRAGQTIRRTADGGYVHTSHDEPTERPTRFQGTTLDDMGY